MIINCCPFRDSNMSNMGKQLASIWTSQVEREDAVDVAGIKAQSESTSPHPPQSLPISMPNTCLQTAHSCPPNPPTLATLDEEFGNLSMEYSRTSPQSSTQPPSSDYDPADARCEAEGIETHTTSRIRKKTRTVTSSQRDLACEANPNNGRCLVTNQPDPIQSCHLVVQATSHETVQVYVSQVTQLYSLHPTHSSRNWSMHGALNIKISMSTQGIT